MIFHIATILLRAIEQPTPIIHLTGEFLKQWPHTVLKAITATRLLQQGGMDTQWRCTRCANTCIADVEWRVTDDGSARPYVRCEHTMEWGAIPLDRKDLQLWHTSFAQLADATARLLALQAPREEVVPERLWWLGGKMIAQCDIDVFLAKGAHWDDAAQLFMHNSRLRECALPLVLVPHTVPPFSPFPAEVPVRSLTALLHDDGTTVALRHEQLAATIRQRHAGGQQRVIPIPTAPGTTWAQVIIEFVNDEHVQIRVGTARYVRSFADMGCADLRKPAPTPSELWHHLRTLAKHDGHLGWATPDAVKERDRQKVRKWMSGIRQRLQAVFPDLAGDPFEPYARCRAYQTKCRLLSRCR